MGGGALDLPSICSLHPNCPPGALTCLIAAGVAAAAASPLPPPSLALSVGYTAQSATGILVSFIVRFHFWRLVAIFLPLVMVLSMIFLSTSEPHFLQCCPLNSPAGRLLSLEKLVWQLIGIHSANLANPNPPTTACFPHTHHELNPNHVHACSFFPPMAHLKEEFHSHNSHVTFHLDKTHNARAGKTLSQSCSISHC